MSEKLPEGLELPTKVEIDLEAYNAMGASRVLPCHKKLEPGATMMAITHEVDPANNSHYWCYAASVLAVGSKGATTRHPSFFKQKTHVVLEIDGLIDEHGFSGEGYSTGVVECDDGTHKYLMYLVSN